MKQDFTEVMSKRTDEELIEIVKVTRDDYQPEAVEAAEKELEKRQVDSDQVEQFQQKLTEKETKKQELESSKVSSWTRLVHFIVDIIAFILTAMVLSLILDLFIPSPDQETMALVGNILFLVAFFLYFVFMEHKYQKTIGKFLTKTKVVMNDGRKPELNDIFYRTASRLIPFDQISYLFTKNGFHDRFSNTTVVKDKKEKTNANIT
jgi:uncharacterized RDD family membrane protein YckC